MKSTPVNALEKVPQEEEDWSDDEGEEKDEVAEQQEEVPQEESKCRRSKRKAASEGVSKPPKSRKASLVTTEPINIPSPTGSVNEEKASLKPQKRKYETSTTASSKHTSTQPLEDLVEEKETNAHLSSQFEEVLLDPVVVAAKSLQPTAFAQECFSRQSGVQDPSQDPELLSTIDRTKNKGNQDKTMAAIDSALFDLSDPFLKNFNDLGKDLVGDNLEQALNDMGSDDLFVELDKMLLGEDPTLAIDSSQAPSFGFSTQAENVPSISLLVECFDLLNDKDIDSLATDKDLMDSLMDKLTQLGAIISQLPLQIKHPTLKLQRFYKDTFEHFMPAQEAIERHQQLIETKTKLFKDLEGLKKKQVGLAKWSATVKANFDEVTAQRGRLEEVNKLAAKESKLLEYEERSKAALDSLKIELSSKLTEVKKLSRELNEAESEAKKAKGIKESLSKQLKDVQQSLQDAKV